MDAIKVNLGNRSYPIHFGSDNLSELGKLMEDLNISKRVAIVTNPTIRALFLGPVKKGLEDQGFQVSTIEIPDGEEYKTLKWASTLYDKLLCLKMDRDSSLIALGGGVIGDITGFVAGTFLRGIPFVQVPTTLLAQVDSSVGGKTGVNHPKGKNLIGVFYQPSLVLIDVNTLKSLEKKEFLSGLAEVIKYGIIWDSALFQYIEDHLDKILALDQESIMMIIKECCSIKSKVVEEDERESGLRSILNFGHTIGHAIEALTKYTEYTHGEAVAMGMVAAALLSVKIGACDESVSHRIQSLIQKAGLPVTPPEFSKEEYRKVIELDKKMGRDRVKFVLTEGIGRVRFERLTAQEISNLLHSKRK